jgi:pyruvate dehydrogenase E1 component beta subunit
VLAEKAILDLRAPVVRVTGYDAPFPFWTIEDEYLPTPARVVEAVEHVLSF